MARAAKNPAPRRALASNPNSRSPRRTIPASPSSQNWLKKFQTF
jgi:hypothetical protein